MTRFHNTSLLARSSYQLETGQVLHSLHQYCWASLPVVPPFDYGVISAMDTCHRLTEAGETETLKTSVTRWKKDSGWLLVHR
jgi:hypothetical protein